MAGIAELTLSLLSETQSKDIQSFLRFDRVQNVILPPHQQDGPDDLPQCKGFGLVILADPVDVETLLREWPWTRNTNANAVVEGQSDSDYLHPENQYRRDAQKFGLRTLPKRRWDELKEEYLAYQRRTLDELVAFNDGSYTVPTTNVPTSTSEQPQAGDMEDEYEEYSELDATPPEAQGQTTLQSEFPVNCLVFVRNVHVETNKTTLRKLFNAALDSSAKWNGLDYVDYVKGADMVRPAWSCHHDSPKLTRIP